MASSEEPAPPTAEQPSPPRAPEVEPLVAHPPQHNVAHVEADVRLRFLLSQPTRSGNTVGIPETEP
jgi:hypothetical protein